MFIGKYFSALKYNAESTDVDGVYFPVVLFLRV